MTRLLLSLCLVWLFNSSCSVATTPQACTLATFTSNPSTDKEVHIAHTTYGGSSVAQSFMLLANGTASNATVQLKRTGTFTTNAYTLTATIESNNGGAPSGIVLATSQTLDASVISSSAATYYTFSLRAPVALLAGVTYWIRIKASYAVGDTNYISWFGHDGSVGGYTVNSTALNAVYETSASSNAFSSALIGANRYLFFTVGC